MEDSFRVRVDKVFGSLPPPSDSRGKETSSLPLSSLWCLTDDEIQRKEWNRDCPAHHDISDSMPYPPNLDGFVFANNNHTDNTAQTVVPSSSQPGPSSSGLNQQFETDLIDIDDISEDYVEDEDEELNSKSKRQCGSPNDDDESNIRSSIGLDCALDYEEEEDDYDKVAVGREKESDHLYMTMRNATEYGTGVNTCNELPDTLEDFVRDPRADHAAAKLRLKEDAEAAGNFDLLRLSDSPQVSSFVLEDGSSRKSIIKKREGLTDIKSQKRVRFNNNNSEIATKESCSIKVEKASGEALNMIQDTSVPDYIRNPSNYTHYTFDAAADMDDDSNRKAYLDFLSLVRKPCTTTVQHKQDDMADNPPKSIMFNPKKTNLDVRTDKVGIKSPNVHVEKYSRVGIALSDDEVSAMEEDDRGIVVDTMNTTLKSSRLYRVRTKRDFDDQE